MRGGQSGALPHPRGSLKTGALFLTLLILCGIYPSYAEGGNPFTDSPEEVTAAAEQFERRGPLAAWLTNLQRQVNVRLTELMRELQQDRTHRVLFTVLGAGFLYGMIHALLPGHRKTLLFSYFLAQDARPYHGVVAGVSLGILHAASATGIILVAYYLLRAGLHATLGDTAAIMNRVTAGLVIAVGAISLGMAVILSGLSVATIVVRTNVLRLVEGRVGHIAHVGLELFGALFLVAFGIFLLFPG